MTSPRYEFGGWSQSLTRAPLEEFNTQIYGMITNLAGLTTGTATAPGWSPAHHSAPRLNGYTGPVLWTYGGGLCSPRENPASPEAVQALVDATVANGWDGVDFDDECSMNIDRVIDAMAMLDCQGKRTQYGFIAGYTYNRPQTTGGAALNQKVAKVITSGHCDRLVHYCYASRMWTDDEIKRYVGPALERSIAHGAEPGQMILALTSKGLTDHNLELFLDQVTRLRLAGLYVWAYQSLSEAHRRTIIERLGLIAPAVTILCT